MKHHDITVAAPRDIATGAAPVILDRSDEDFLDAILEDLRSESGRTRLAQSRASARTGAQVLKLYQPIQRRFHVALIEAWCEAPGRPRIDPRKVEKAGMVLRRLRQDATRGTVVEGWMRTPGSLRGWVEAERLGGPQADPSPAPRLATLATGRPALDRSLAPLFAARPDALLSEHVIPMFVTPPDVCAEAGRTVYYGIVPTTSSERASAPPDTASAFEGFGPETSAFREHLVGALRGEAMALPLAGRILKADPDPNQLPDPALAIVILLLRQIAIEFDAFGESAQSRTLFSELEKISLPLVPRQGESAPRTVTAGSFLRQASRVLLERDPEAPEIEMPASWPALDQTARTRLGQALFSAMTAGFYAIKGAPGRFDEPGARYVLRAFVRLKPEDGCPAKTVWSDYGEPFVIAPWYEGSGAPPVQVALPDATDRDLLKALKPNVAFVVPASLQNLLGGDPKELADGKGSTGEATLGWICSFSLPIITLCAFIVLNIFLSLFDLIFRWLLFIKICIPFPKSGDQQ